MQMVQGRKWTIFDGVQQIRISRKALLVSGTVVKANKRS